jgi:hypothetical protein
MRWLPLLPSVLGLGLFVNTCSASTWTVPGALVGVSVSLDGRSVPLYPAPDGSGRYYLEARAGSRYEVELANRTHERVGVVLAVDGLNAISGERQTGSAPGRMYVLDPWESATVRGWRRNLDEIQRFTFVDERASYAARSGKANGKMGWIEVAVYGESRPYRWRERPGIDEGARGYERDYEADERLRPQEEALNRTESARDRAEAPPATAAPAPPRAQAESEAGKLKSGRADGFEESRPGGSYPGTGWGQRTEDRVQVVSFEPQSSPSERVTVRYEYASALRALGILPQPHYGRDRLREREHGDAGFAKPPVW